MAYALTYAAASHVGLIRGNNEDSAYAGPHLLALADGMGGHAAGETKANSPPKTSPTTPSAPTSSKH